MIRKLAHIDAPVDVVMDVFRDTDAWPQWMPGVASTRTLDTGPDHRRAEVILLVMGRRLVQQLECREQDGRLTHRQVAGWFREWHATWTFQPPPGGQGTTVSLSLKLDIGIAGMFVPRKLLGAWVQTMIDDTIVQGRERAQRFAQRRREPTQVVPLGQPVLQVYETSDGFEVHFAGRTFLVEATDISEA